MFEEILDNVKNKSIDLVPEVKSKEKNISNQLKFYKSYRTCEANELDNVSVKL